MNTALFKAVFGEHETPTAEILRDLSVAITALPGNLFNAMFLHYYRNKTLEDVAQLTNHPVHLVNTWLKHGVAFLKIACSVPL